jgi:basic amino acid/polyamine antiporter, APA family
MTADSRQNHRPARPAPAGASISLFTATCIVVANMVGTGVFTSLGFQVGTASQPGLTTGFPILLLWTVGGVCALCGALAYGELAAALPRSGGEYHYLSVIYHPSVGFLAGWLSITVGFAAPVALAAMALGKYFHDVFPTMPAMPLSLVAVAAVTAVHLAGVRAGSLFQNAATILKVALVGALIVAGFLLAAPQPMPFLPARGDGTQIASSAFATSLVFVMYAYSGWNASAYIVHEVRQSARNVPLSVGIGTAVVMALYVAVNAVFLHATPIAAIQDLPWEKKETVAGLAAAHIFGHEGGRWMSALICAGLISSISAMTWVGPRVSMTMGQDWSAMRWLGHTSASGVPVVAIVVQSAIVGVLVLTNSFQAVLTYIQLALTASSFLAVLGVFVLRVRRPEIARPYRTWGYPVTPIIFLAVSAWMMWHIVQMNPRESLAGLATMVAGLAFYLVSSRRTGAPESR